MSRVGKEFIPCDYHQEAKISKNLHKCQYYHNGQHFKQKFFYARYNQ